MLGHQWSHGDFATGPLGGFNVRNAVKFDVNSASLDVGNTRTFGKCTSLLTRSVMQFGLPYQR
jgi:hypothetical protein